MIEEQISRGGLGWSIRSIREVNEKRGSVTLNDGVVFWSACFRGAQVGDIWAVKHEDAGPWAFGAVSTAFLLERAE